MAEQESRVLAFIEVAHKLTLEIARKLPGKNAHEASVYSAAIGLVNQSVVVAELNIRKSRRLISQARRLATFKVSDKEQ